MLREYITLGGATIAIIDAGGINYVHNDHLATPQVMTDGAAAVVWDASYRPFGEATIAGAAANQQRFPGQTADAETGYSDNWYRTYDASLGRYLQSDPIGLMAGFNTYAYAGGNPVMNMDPTGQFIMFVPLFWAVVEAVVIGVTIYEVVNIAKRVTERYRNGCRGWDLITRWEITEIVLLGKLKWLKFLRRPFAGGKGAPGFAMSGGGGVPGVPTRPRGPGGGGNDWTPGGGGNGGAPGGPVASGNGGRGLWEVTRGRTGRVMQHPRTGNKYYRHDSTGNWWSRDRAGHGGSEWKVYQETNNGLEWIADADQYGDYIVGKHKGPVGRSISWNDLNASGF